MRGKKDACRGVQDATLCRTDLASDVKEHNLHGCRHPSVIIGSMIHDHL